jgi:GT2 family glycosyltransferase
MYRHDYDADIIILSLERAEDTVAAIQSALAQTGITRRVIVLDQGSGPATLARLRQVCAGQADVILDCAGTNLGVPGGRNRASMLGTGRVIIGLDNDAVFAAEDTAARAVAALDAEPGLAAIGLRILRHADGADDLSSWGYAPGLRAHAGAIFDSVTFVGAGHAIRRAVWERLGGYDAGLFFCWEEYEFCLRAIAQGWAVRYRGDIAVRHKVSAEARQTWSGQRWFYFVRNRILIARRFGASWSVLLPRILGYVLRGQRNGLLPATLRGIAAAARMQAGQPRITLPPAARDYLRRNDGAHRQNLLGRLRSEILAALPTPRAPEQPEHQRIIQQVAPP